MKQDKTAEIFETEDLEKRCDKLKNRDIDLWIFNQGKLKERQRCSKIVEKDYIKKSEVEKVLDDWADSLCGKETKRKGDKVYFDWDVFIVNVKELKKRLGI